jgi:hypothetical protein
VNERETWQIGVPPGQIIALFKVMAVVAELPSWIEKETGVGLILEFVDALAKVTPLKFEITKIKAIAAENLVRSKLIAINSLLISTRG